MHVQTFESIIILDEYLTEEEYKTALYNLREQLISISATKIKTEELGKKKLAYICRKCHYGWYIVFTFQLTENLEKWDSILRKDDNVIKFISRLTEEEYIPDPEPTQSEQSSRLKKPIDIFDLIYDIKEM